MRVSIINFTVPVFAQLYLPYLLYDKYMTVCVRVWMCVCLCGYMWMGEECVDACVRVGGGGGCD